MSGFLVQLVCQAGRDINIYIQMLVLPIGSHCSLWFKEIFIFSSYIFFLESLNLIYINIYADAEIIQIQIYISGVLSDLKVIKNAEEIRDLDKLKIRQSIR